MEKKKSSYLK
jgi:hypothetical protein